MKLNEINMLHSWVGHLSFLLKQYLKGPNWEFPYYVYGDDPIGWLIACEKIYNMSGTPYDQWINLATGIFKEELPPG